MKKQTFLFSIFLLGLLGFGFAQQQIIGMFPRMNGGFENLDAGSVLNVYSSGIANGIQKDSFTSNNATCVGTIVNSGGRSSSKNFKWETGSTSNALWTPTQVSTTVTSNTPYVVQFFYKKVGTGSARNFTLSISPDGTQSFGTTTNTILLGMNGIQSSDWVMDTTKVTSGNDASSPRYGILQFKPNGGSFNTLQYYLIDDLVMYPGTIADRIPPNKPQTTVASSLSAGDITVGWDVPSGGVDNGGYVVVRTTTNPALTPINPNQNGIYAVGNTIGTGTVAYIGTANSFIDPALTWGFTYYYLVFAVDKAFNYSIPDTASYLLPVSLTNFTAQKKANKNLLSWHTTTENNNHGFYLERSANGSTFTTLQFAPSKANGGNSSSILQYHFTDELPIKGCNYYRLKQTDKDGRHVYSQTIMLKTDAKKTIELVNIFPSPASTLLQVQYQSDAAIPVYFTITDITGRILLQQKATATAGENTTQINVAMLRKGNYFLKLSEAVNKPVATKKFSVK